MYVSNTEQFGWPVLWLTNIYSDKQIGNQNFHVNFTACSSLQINKYLRRKF